MKNKNGYILLESLVSLGITSILVLLLYSTLMLSVNAKNLIEDKIELQQQAIDITRQIEAVIGNSKGIIEINARTSNENKYMDFKDISSIKCRYTDGKNDDGKNLEISLKENLNKVFINGLNDGISKSGGYEIGDYIDNIYIRVCKDEQCVDLILELSKNNRKYETEFSVYIRNYEGDTI